MSPPAWGRQGALRAPGARHTRPFGPGGSPDDLPARQNLEMRPVWDL